MAKALEDYFEEKARAGDGSFAVAYSLLMISKAHDRLAQKIGQLGFDGPGTSPGALEFIGMQLRDIRGELEHLTISASVDVNNG